MATVATTDAMIDVFALNAQTDEGTYFAKRFGQKLKSASRVPLFGMVEECIVAVAGWSIEERALSHEERELSAATRAVQGCPMHGYQSASFGH